MLQARIFHAALKTNNIIHVVGGSIGEEFVSSTEMYNTENDLWAKGPDLPYALKYAAAEVDSGDKFALIFGRKNGSDEKH